MDFDGVGTSNSPGMGMSSTHKRSKSLSSKKQHEDKPDNFFEASNPLKLILQLERRLEDQVAIRRVLEKALGYTSSCRVSTNEIAVPKSTMELVKEIAVLELEVLHLEHYLLSLYRKAFDQQICSSSPSVKNEGLKSPLRGSCSEFPKSDITSRVENRALQSNCQLLANPWKGYNGIGGEERLLDSQGALRCHSSVSQGATLSTITSTNPLGRAVRACHSQPLSMMEYSQNASSNMASLADHLGTRISDHVPETPNKLSEDMIKCMSAIYCKLADPSLSNNGLSSPTSSLSSTSAFSPKDHSGFWSPGIGKASSFDVRLENPFHIQGLKEFSGPYSTMVEVQCIHRDIQNLGDIEHMLQNFRSIISQLEEIDPKKMQNEEKLAFWINVHNALVMHAAYNVGGHVVSADVIQNSILGCRMSRPGQWLRMLLPSRTKFKAGDGRQAYAIEHPEPLLHFALSSGSHSDPAVRVYTAKKVLQELETAKEDYIRATFGVRKDQKILLPKIVESFAKDSGLCQAGVLKMIQQCLPESLRKSINNCQQVKSRKIIDWIPHNFAFRYLVSKEMVK
ncbi:hypothetical protein LguiB_019512 [Lonicera macranthoides]